MYGISLELDLNSTLREHPLGFSQAYDVLTSL